MGPDLHLEACGRAIALRNLSASFPSSWGRLLEEVLGNIRNWSKRNSQEPTSGEQSPAGWVVSRLLLLFGSHPWPCLTMPPISCLLPTNALPSK